MNADKLNKILAEHKQWIEVPECGQRAVLRGAYLRGAYLRGAYLSGANLSGADLSGVQIVDAGQDRRGYQFWAWLHEGVIKFRAGCKNFESYEEAKAHYSENYTSDGDVKECLSRIKFLNKEANRRWKKELIK